MKKVVLLDHINSLIARGELEQAIKIALQYLENDEFILYSFRFNQIEKHYKKGIVTFEQYQVETNKITSGILKEIQGLPLSNVKPQKRNRLFILLILSSLFVDWKRIGLIFKSLVSIGVIFIGVIFYSQHQKITDESRNEYNQTQQAIDTVYESNITSNSATLNAKIHTNDPNNIAQFRILPLNQTYIANMTKDTSMLTSNVSNLNLGKTYCIRMELFNDADTLIGDWKMFATLDTANSGFLQGFPTPSAKIGSLIASNITHNSAILNAEFSIFTDAYCWFETNKGDVFQVQRHSNTTNSYKPIKLISYLWMGLKPNTTYSFRAIAVNEKGLGMTSFYWASFTTLK